MSKVKANAWLVVVAGRWKPPDRDGAASERMSERSVSPGKHIWVISDSLIDDIEMNMRCAHRP
jgi:hypothetical protein